MAIAGYQLRVNGGPLVNEIIDVGNVLIYEVSGLDPGTEHDLEVRSYDDSGNFSAWSSVLTAETVELPFEGYSTTNLRLWFAFKTRSAYVGPCCRVKRASDSVELDINFLSTEYLDYATYAAFGTGSEKVIKIYDQVGSGEDFEHATAGPIITIDPWNGQPCFDWSAAGGRLEITGFDDWDGLTKGQFIWLQRTTEMVNGHQVIRLDGSYPQLAQAYGAPADIINTYMGNTNVHHHRSFGGTVRRMKFDGGGATNADKLQLFIDGEENIADAYAAQAANFSGTGISWNGTSLSGETCKARYAGFAWIGDTRVEDVAATDGLLQEIYAHGVKPKLVIDGDSIAKGYPSSPTDPEAFGMKIKGLLETETGTVWVVVNNAEVAEQTDTILLGYSTTTDNSDDLAPQNVTIVWCGTNNLAADLTGGAGIVTAALDDIEDMVQRAIATKFRVVAVGNILPRTDIDNVNPQFETDRASFNSQLITRMAAYPEAVVFDAASLLNDENDTAHFQLDRVHLNEGGNIVAAAQAFAVIQPNLD
jgi:lysophospholipase L1-like esterase